MKFGNYFQLTWIKEFSYDLLNEVIRPIEKV